MFLDYKASTQDGGEKKRNFYAQMKTPPQKNAVVFNQHQNTPQQIVTQNQKKLLIKTPPKILDRIKNQPNFEFDDTEDSWEYAMQPEKKTKLKNPMKVTEKQSFDLENCSQSIDPDQGGQQRFTAADFAKFIKDFL